MFNISKRKNVVDNSNNIFTLEKNIFSQNCLSSLINGYPYLAYTESSIDFHSLNILVNDIIINNRKRIIEFGSGISTIIIGRLIKLNNINCTIYSIDDNKEWINIMTEYITRENLSNHVKLIYSPLSNILELNIKNHHLKWYDIATLENEFNDKLFDMVIVDGPMAYCKDIERSRFPALLYVKNKLNNDFSIFLHDTNREGEKSIIRDWEIILEIKAKQYTEKMTGFLAGRKFTFEI